MVGQRTAIESHGRKADEVLRLQRPVVGEVIICRAELTFSASYDRASAPAQVHSSKNLTLRPLWLVF